MKIVITLLLLLGSAGILQAQWIDDTDVDEAIKQGILDTYNLRFEQADKAFQKVVAKYPDHPAGYFFLAMVEWWRILIDIDDESRDDRFYDQLDRIVDRCDDRLDRNDRDLAALFFKGGAIGFKGRLQANRKEWVSAATTGREALPVVMDASELAPNNPDLAFGTGIYDYYASVLPEKYPVLKPLMVFLPEGNKERGLAELADAAEHGKYASWEATYFLLQVHYSLENKPSIALRYARKLHDQFPENPVFHRYLGRVYVKLGNWKKAAPVFAEIVDWVARGKRGYTDKMSREAAYYLGYNAMLTDDYSEAIKQFVLCDKLSRSLKEDEPSGFMIMANLRMGMTHDLLNQRSYALKQYDKVLRMPEYRNSHDAAEQFKKNAYKR